MQLLTKSLRSLPSTTGNRPLQALLLRNGFPSYSTSSDEPTPVELSFDEYQGEGQPTQAPLITIHGLFGSKQNWRGISKALVRKVPRKVRISGSVLVSFC